MPANWRLKEARPFPLRGDSLWKDCFFATACGWEKGFGLNTTPPLGSIEDVSSQRAIWEDTANVTASNYTFGTPGRGTNNAFNSVALGGSRLTWQRTNSGERWYTNYGVSGAILYMPNVDQSSTETLIHFRPSPYNNTNPGWSINIVTGSFYQAEVCDGAVEASAVSTTAESSAARRVDLIVFTYDRSNLRIFLNGKLEATTAATLTVGNPTNQDIKIFGTGASGGTIANGSVWMAAAWRRALSRGDINRLYSDPLAMWRDQPDDDGDFALMTYLAAF